VRPAPNAPLVAERNVVAGNVLLYGATDGEVFVRGLVGERFAVRNSGATAVVEGVGDHGCEYMTGGQVVVLGGVGRNFAAGMSGGTAYVLDLHEVRVNREMVDLEPLDPEDADLLQVLVQRHVEHTGSTVGSALLEDWTASAARFTKVMPRDYKAVLLARSRALEAGFDDDSPETLDAIMEASRG
jgi:glutamate synthase (NADPH/NADH) large chain